MSHRPVAALPGSALAGADERCDTVRTTGFWFGQADRPHLGWLSHATPRLSDSGVVVLPPVGYAYWCAHRTLRVIAERLAGQGHAVLRIDYDGTGDSAGDQWDPDRVRMWRATAETAVQELRGLGCARITVVGARLGATFALLDGQSLGAQRIVAWAPVLSGRRYVKELRLLSMPVPQDADRYGSAGTLVSAGNVFSGQTLADLERLAITDTNAPSATRILVLDDPVGTAGPIVAHLRSVGADVRHARLPGAKLVLETAPELATVPEAIVTEVCGWLGPAQPGSGGAPPNRRAVQLSWGGRQIREEVLSLGERRHIGVLASPLDPDPARSTLVFLNPGSETHVGPGRAWVEYARSLAGLGYSSARVDFRGWGESPDAGRAPGRPYDARAEDDALAIVRALRAAGHERVVLLGLCASAWIALRAVLQAPVAGVIALNPQLYWRQGDPVEIDWKLIRDRRATEIKRIAIGDRWRLWSLLDVLGRRPAAGAWLDQLDATGVPIALLFADGDDGLEFLRRRLRRRLAHVQRRGRITVGELPGVDHPMHLTWLRPRVLAALHDALRRIDASSGVSGVQARPSTQRGRDHSCHRSSSWNPAER